MSTCAECTRLLLAYRQGLREYAERTLNQRHAREAGFAELAVAAIQQAQRTCEESNEAFHRHAAEHTQYAVAASAGGRR